MARKTVKDETQTALFAASRRRCCVCCALHSDYSVKRGQIAHLNGNASDARLDNLVWLCLEHHDLYDSRTSQSKGLTTSEVRHYRQTLYKSVALETGPTAQNADLIHAYLTFIDPDVSPSDRYADILSHHLGSIHDSVDRLRRDGDWKTLLEIRSRLREYFEYSGRYEDGYNFGLAFADALTALDLHHERRWCQVKDIGYMLILDDNHSEGRTYIRSVLTELEDDNTDALINANATLSFYAYRYLGISNERAKKPDFEEARKCFGLARNAISPLFEASSDYLALSARITRNFGNLACDEGDFFEALKCHHSCLGTFHKLEDLEHEGIACLKIGETLIRQNAPGGPDPVPYLTTAQSAFAQIAWLEGQGRVHQQFARRYLAQARRVHGAAACKLADQALQEAETARGIFKRMKSERFRGRIDALIDEIREYLAVIKAEMRGVTNR